MEYKQRAKSASQPVSPDPAFGAIPQGSATETWPGDDREEQQGWALKWDARALAELVHPVFPTVH